MRALLTVALALALGVSASPAQETTGRIQGRLRSDDGRPIIAAQVSATSPDLLGTRRAVSAADGVFLLLALPPGSYTLRIAAIGFRPLAVQAVQVQLGKVSGLGDLPMERAAVTLAELTITAPPVTLDPVRTTIGANLTREEYDILPSDRDYKSLIAIIPHVNTSFHGDPVNSMGATGLENAYFIDGMNVTDPQRALTGTSLPYNFIRSVEVRSGGYEARFGKALGAIVNAVTYTGTNDFEANVFGYFAQDAFAATPKAMPVLRTTDSYDYDIGLRISGPVRRDRLWFSAAYNPRFQHATKQIGSLGSFPDSRTGHVFAGKLTWQAGSATQLELTLLGDPTRHNQVDIFELLAGLRPLNPEPYLHRAETGGITGSLHGNTRLGSRVLLEATAAHARMKDSQVASTELGHTTSALADYVAGTLDGGVQQEVRKDLQRSSISVVATGLLGLHTPSAGADYERVRSALWVQNPGIGYLVHQDPATYGAFEVLLDGVVKGDLLALFLQDTWRLGQRLTVNAGVRWSQQLHRAEDGRIAQAFRGEWQPRAGVSFELGHDGRQRVFGSVGRFYQQDPLRLSTEYFTPVYFTSKTYDRDPRTAGAVLLDSMRYSASQDESIDYAGNAEGASVEHLNEVSAGYERVLGRLTHLTIRGVYRATTGGLLVIIDSTGTEILGTPGRGRLGFMAPTSRKYTALELSLNGEWRRLRYRASYVLSRAKGNYTGLYSSDTYTATPGKNLGLHYWYQIPNSTGLLPNDRPHVFKLTASYSFGSVFSAGGFFSWMSGTPLTELGSGPGSDVPSFLQPRGTGGRTPALWDVNLRLVRDQKLGRGMSGRLVLDVLHLGNPQQTVRQDQRHYQGVDAQGNQTLPNANYLHAIAFQPPMAARLGIEFGF